MQSRSHLQVLSSRRASDDAGSSSDEESDSSSQCSETSTKASSACCTEITECQLDCSTSAEAPSLQDGDEVDLDERAQLRKDLLELTKYGAHSRPLKCSTLTGIDHIEKRWKDYCHRAGLGDPVSLLRQAKAPVFKAFFKDIDRPGRVGRITLLQYLRVLKQYYRREKGKSLSTKIAKDVKMYIEALCQHKEHGEFKEKTVFSGVDFRRMQHFLYKEDTALYRSGRERVSVGFLITIHAFSGLRPNSTTRTMKQEHDAAAALTYRNFALKLVKDEDGRSRFVLEAMFDKFKGQRAQRKLLRWFDQSDVFICPVAHFIALAMHDKAFDDDRLNESRNLFSLKVPEGQAILPIATKQSFQDQTILKSASGQELTDNAARKRLHCLAVSMGMQKPKVTFYSFRRSVLNVVDGVASSAVRRQLAGHAGDNIFGEHYIDQCINLDIAALVLGNKSEEKLMSNLRDLTVDADPRANQALTNDEMTTINAEPTVKCLMDMCDDLSQQLRSTYGFINKAPKSDPVLQKHDECRRRLHTVKARISQQLRSSKRTQFFNNKVKAHIDAQLNGTGKSEVLLLTDTSCASTYISPEQALFRMLPDDISMTMGSKRDERITVMQALVDLCDRIEYRRGREPGPPPVSTESLLPASTDKTSEVGGIAMLLDCRQCVFCIGDYSLHKQQREKKYSRVQSLWAHVSRTHTKTIDPQQAIACGHPICKGEGLLLNNLTHLLSHSHTQHGVRLQCR